jgi:hypothetical protein
MELGADRAQQGNAISREVTSKHLRSPHLQRIGARRDQVHRIRRVRLLVRERRG